MDKKELIAAITKAIEDSAVERWEMDNEVEIDHEATARSGFITKRPTGRSWLTIQLYRETTPP